MSTGAPDWGTLGNLLVRRRVQLNPHYKNRRKFVADTHSGSEDSWYRMITSIETGARTNYSRETLAAMEIAYQLEPGSLDRSLRTQALEPQRQAAMAAAPVMAGGSAQEAPPASEIERRVLEELRTQAEASDKSIGDILVERGLASPDELMLSEEKRGDPLVKQILESNLPDETKNLLLMDYVGRRRHHFRKEGILGGPEEK